MKKINWFKKRKNKKDGFIYGIGLLRYINEILSEMKL